MPGERAPATVTDVRPLRDGTWLATCECGHESVQDDVDAGWSWVLTHLCPIAD